MAGVLEGRPEEAVVGCQFATDLVAPDNDNISFPSSGIFGNTVRNPLRFKADIWPVRLQSFLYLMTSLAIIIIIIMSCACCNN